jgi:hypothetical protein
MPVFDGSIKTKTRVRLDHDAFTPKMGALTGSGFKEDALIHGTRNEVVDGDITLLYKANVKRTIVADLTATTNGNVTRLTAGTTTENLVGNVTRLLNANHTQSVLGNEVVLNVGTTLHTRIGAVTELNPTATMRNSGDHYETKIFKGQNYAIRNTNIAVDIATRLENFQIGLHTTNLIQFQTRMEVTEAAVKLVNLIAGVNLTDLKASQLRAIAADGMMAAGKLLVGPRVQAPPESLPGIE